jgi:MFS family permease
MLQRLIGVSIGALVTFGILWLSTIAADEAALLSWYAAAVLIGGIGSFFWPVVAGIWLGRRARGRDDEIRREVDRQVEERMTRFVIGAGAAIPLAGAEIEVADGHELPAPTSLRSQILAAHDEAVPSGETPAGLAARRAEGIVRTAPVASLAG